MSCFAIIFSALESQRQNLSSSFWQKQNIRVLCLISDIQKTRRPIQYRTQAEQGIGPPESKKFFKGEKSSKMWLNTAIPLTPRLEFKIWAWLLVKNNTKLWNDHSCVHQTGICHINPAWKTHVSAYTQEIKICLLVIINFSFFSSCWGRRLLSCDSAQSCPDWKWKILFCWKQVF